MIGYDVLRTVLPTLPAARFHGFLFRRVNLAALLTLSPPQFLYALGASRGGGRYTPRGGPASLYAATDEATAAAEANQAGGFAPFRPATPPPPPAAIYGLAATLTAVLDVADAAVQARLGTTGAELRAPWRLAGTAEGGRAPTQTLGQATFDAGGFQAIRYPSARHPGGVCMVIFPDRLDGATSFVEVFDPGGAFRERLPR